MTARLSYVYEAGNAACLGFILERGRAGYEALDNEERSLGIYETRREAAIAVMRRGLPCSP
jgi:hypothetical protein